jgi:hypothetical protein
MPVTLPLGAARSVRQGRFESFLPSPPSSKTRFPAPWLDASVVCFSTASNRLNLGIDGPLLSPAVHSLAYLRLPEPSPFVRHKLSEFSSKAQGH